MLHCELEIWDGVHITPLLHTPFDQHRHTRTVHCPVFISFQRFWAMKMSLCSFTIQLQVSLKLLTQALPSTKKKKKRLQEAETRQPIMTGTPALASAARKTHVTWMHECECRSVLRLTKWTNYILTLDISSEHGPHQEESYLNISVSSPFNRATSTGNPTQAGTRYSKAGWGKTKHNLYSPHSEPACVHLLDKGKQ